MMELDHDCVLVDEFDALAIEVKVPPKSAQAPPPTPPSGSPTREKPLAAFSSEKYGKFPAKAHAQKVAAKLSVQNGLIFLPGGEEQYYEFSDMGPAFRQRRHFYYLSGADFRDCSITYDIARDHLILWIPYTDPKTVLWYGSTPSIEACKAASHVDDVRYSTGLERFLYVALSPGITLYVLEPNQKPKIGTTKGVVHIDTSKLRLAIDAARVVKTDYEVAMIRRANAISSAAHKSVLARIKRLTNEREIEAIFQGFCTAQGAKHVAYPIIAGSGANASTLHYDDNNATLDPQNVVVLDAGAEWHCYASDVTRTFPASGRFTPEAAAIYAVVERMQTECVERIRPGTVFHTLQQHACIVAVTELLRLGILHNGSVYDICSKGTVSAFFPHGLGHHVGLEVHDVTGGERLILGSVAAAAAGAKGPRAGVGMMGKREWMSPEMLAVMYRDAVAVPPRYQAYQRLEKNMVVTVEPGIYFCREYIQAFFLDNPVHAKYINKKVLEKYYPVGGVRIEDCILVTEDGYENLTTAPKGEDMLKVINGS
ncbi:peptidase M24, structural domain-containing protein [Podospora appendiculata]|uniref:Xaa-Pro aminopeptidase n=1 Tax=Podospora appendiculata TaxID=314037 RepID=A0AAE0XF76_9PEZI|nr:peptidase M24, structural domain-containing protein [Podospora appendiculata]